MYPPRWVLVNSIRVDLDGFGRAFTEAWSALESRFWKLECWQAYREQEANESQAAYERGDVGEAVQLLQDEAQADQPLYEDVRRRGIDYARIRLVHEPWTEYLRYEFLSYRIRAEMGETIEIVTCDPALSLADQQYFDCLLFDRHTALIHDYGNGDVGCQSGGWLTHHVETIDRLAGQLEVLRERAVPLLEYLAET